MPAKPRIWPARLLCLLWIALLSFSIPEVFAGTGAGWMLKPGMFIRTIPLYALHFLLLTHIAARTGRTSWPALYMFGLLFGLYESWITKVLWAGYPEGAGFAMGELGASFGIHESFGLILFYHAVTSFLLPLAVATRLFPAYARVFPSPDWVFGTGRKPWMIRVALILCYGLTAGHTVTDLNLFLITWLPMLAGLWFGYLLLRHAGATTEGPREAIAAPLLSRFGVWIAVLWLGAIYAASFLNLRPQDIPPEATMIITLILYPLLAWLIWRSPRQKPDHRPAPFKPSKLLLWVLPIFLIGLSASLLPAPLFEIRAGLTLVAFIAMIPTGAMLFLWLVLLPLRPLNSLLPPP